MKQPEPRKYSGVEPHADGESAVDSPSRLRSLLAAQNASQPQSIRLRDGELVVYRRSRSLLYQCRYRLSDGTWVRQTTGRAALEHAIARACDIYDEARYRQRLGLAHRTHSVAQIAAICCAQLRQEIDAKGKKSALNDYLSFVERYFVVCADPRRVVLKRSRGVQGARPIRACALAQRDRLRPESTG